jgi:hypothetical protein
MEPLRFEKTTDETVIKFTVKKRRFTALFSKQKERAFYLTSPDPLSDWRLCQNQHVQNLVNGEHLSKKVLARILATAMIPQRFLLLPGALWVLTKYFHSKLDVETLEGLAKVAVTLSSYSAMLKPIFSETTLYLITRNIFSK